MYTYTCPAVDIHGQKDMSGLWEPDRSDGNGSVLTYACPSGSYEG
ncbi:MAG TPA: hypothetical protein VMT35_03390 [Ignavibacteriaceae bacterium]|nr:hypothetical protein [Ignavibacteriaceae bacterium]